ncbi:hypothetical protein [Streptomyces lichenis]|uniref:Uncharacterized protein n=1 Tax=Streptomyces lichenis TaxID=2306967 RepID=A0ABT0I7N9_9ACTN|nr:hypothetical protein [Streptomyces lichenis]MCK8677312.1 hypothetical protein [Streptomyces lichenis]
MEERPWRKAGVHRWRGDLCADLEEKELAPGLRIEDGTGIGSGGPEPGTDDGPYVEDSKHLALTCHGTMSHEETGDFWRIDVYARIYTADDYVTACWKREDEEVAERNRRHTNPTTVNAAQFWFKDQSSGTTIRKLVTCNGDLLLEAGASGPSRMFYDEAEPTLAKITQKATELIESSRRERDTPSGSPTALSTD